jgi:glycosyltransferase involved in cell wall biosynthesis
MARFRLGHFLHHYPNPGGTTTAVLGLSRALVRLGWEVVIYSCSGDGEPGEYEELPGMRAARYRRPLWRHGFGVDRRLLARLSRNEDDISLLVINGMFKPLNAVVARTARQAGIPYVMWPHDPYHPELLGRGLLRRLLYGRFFERGLLSGAAAVHVLAESHKELLARYGVHTSTFVVPDGFDPEQVPQPGPLNDAEPATPTELLRFLYLGRLDAYNKGLDLLLEGMSLGLAERALPLSTRLDLVGADRGSRRELESLQRRLGLGENVQFRGYIATRSPWNIISSYDVVVLPSRWDGFALAVLEAMVMEKPVVVSDQAGIASYVEKARCGWTVQPNARSICDGLVRAARSRHEWRDIGRRGKDFAYANLTWDKVAEDASSHYERLLRQVPVSVPAERRKSTACTSTGPTAAAH